MRQSEVFEKLLKRGASSSAVRSWRWRFSTRACSTELKSLVVRTMAGIVAKPARWVARQRRSPAINSYWSSSSSSSLTKIGCNTPISAIDAANSTNVSSSKWCRGWFGFGETDAVGISTNVPVSPPGPPSIGMSELNPFPSPLRRAIVYLLGCVAIRQRASRRRIKCGNRLSERWCLTQTNGSGNH